MTKYIAGILYGFVLVMDFIGIQDHNSIVHWFLTINRTQILLHIGLAVGLLLYSLIPQIRYRFTQIPVIALGLALIMSGISSIISPDYLTHNNGIVLALDIFFYVEGGILTALVGLEAPIRHFGRVENEFDEELTTTHSTTLSQHPNT